MKEVKLIYNPKDDKHYLCIGEAFINGYDDNDSAVKDYIKIINNSLCLNNEHKARSKSNFKPIELISVKWE